MKLECLTLFGNKHWIIFWRAGFMCCLFFFNGKLAKSKWAVDLLVGVTLVSIRISFLPADGISHHHILSKLGMHPWRQEECPCPHTKLLPNIHQYSYIWCTKFGQRGFIPLFRTISARFLFIHPRSVRNDRFFPDRGQETSSASESAACCLTATGCLPDVEGMDGCEELYLLLMVQKYGDGEKTSWAAL